MTLSQSGTSSWKGRARILLALGALFGCPTLAAAQGAAAKAPLAPLCTFDTKSHAARRLGTPYALVKGGVHSPDDLARMWEEHAAEITCLLQASGLGDLDPLLRAAATEGTPGERDLGPTECFDWMSWRGQGGVKAGPLCLKTDPGKVYRAYTLVAKTESMISEAKADPQCAIKARGNLQAETITVDISGSSPGAAASWRRTDGEHGELSGAGPIYELPWKCPDLCRNDYTFTVAASEQGRQTWAVNSYELIVPQICGNLSYNDRGKTSREEERSGEPRDCTKSATVRKTFPPGPTVTLAVDPVEVRTRRPFRTIQASAVGMCLQSVVTELHGARGAHLAEYDAALKENPTSSFTIRRPGQYSLVSTATNECGQSSLAETQVLVKPRWTVRGFGAWVDPKEDAIHTERTLPGDVRESTSYNLRQGAGIGGSAEYHATDRVGIEGGVLFGRVGSLLRKDLGSGRAQQKKDVTFTSLSLGPNFHLLGAVPGRPDLYLGPFVSWRSFAAKSYAPIGAGDRRSLESTYGLGVQVGYDRPLKRSTQWSLHFGARYEKLAPDLKLGNGGKTVLDVDPLTLAAGVSYSF